MSVAVLRWVAHLPAPAMTPTAHRVLLLLVLRSKGGSGEQATAPVAWVADEIECSPRAVTRALKELREKEYIEIVPPAAPRTDRGRWQAPRTYDVLSPTLLHRRAAQQVERRRGRRS